MSSHKAPKNIWQVNSSLQFDEPLDGAQDRQWVNTYAAIIGAATRSFEHYPPT